MSLATLAAFKQYVADVQASSAYKAWSRDNPGELKKWSAVRDEVLKGGRPALPTLATKFGKSMIDAAREHLEAGGDLRVVVTGTAKVGSRLTATIEAVAT